MILVKSGFSYAGRFRILHDVDKTIPDSIGNAFERSLDEVPDFALPSTPKTPITVRVAGFGQKLREPWGEAGLTWGSTYTRLDTDWTNPRAYPIQVAAPELLIHALLALNRPQNASLEQTRWLEEAFAAAFQRWVFPTNGADVFMPPQVDQMFRKDWTGEIPFEVGMGDDQSAAQGYVESMFMDYLINLANLPDGEQGLGWSLVGSICKYPSSTFTPMAALKAVVKPLTALWQDFTQNIAQNLFYQSHYPDLRWSADQRRALKLSILDVASHNQQTLSTTPIPLNWSAGGLAAKFFLITLDKSVTWTPGTDLAVHLLSSTGAEAFVYGAMTSTGEVVIAGGGLINDQKSVQFDPATLQPLEALLVAIVNPSTGASGTITVTLTPEGFGSSPPQSANPPVGFPEVELQPYIHLTPSSYAMEGYIGTDYIGTVPVTWSGQSFSYSQSQVQSDQTISLKLSGSVSNDSKTIVTLSFEHVDQLAGRYTATYKGVLVNVPLLGQYSPSDTGYIYQCTSQVLGTVPSTCLQSYTTTTVYPDGTTKTAVPDFSSQGGGSFTVVFKK